MKTKYFLSFIILGFGIIISGFLLSSVSAQTAPNIQYPVSELGNCQNETACRAYCDKPENMKVCLAFAEKNNLMSQEELQQAKNFMAAGAKGPGGCTDKDACEKYCNNISRIDECVSFAEKNNLMPAKDLAEAKKVQAALKRGVKPPPCGNKDQCDIYCSEPDHMEECITFGVEAGFIQGKELEDSQKMLAAIKKGIKPPPCKGKEECDQYCQNPDNMQVCMEFAAAAGFMSDQEKQDSQKMLQALKKGVKPPACKGKDECDVYCSEESHFEECTKFAEAAGFMTPQEAEMARKTGGKGPGGCKGKEECNAFCNNLDNQETCFNFAKGNGMIPQEDLRRMEEGKQKFQESLNQAPPEVITCLNSSVGSELMEKFKSGAAMPPREIGDKMGECFSKVMGPGGPGGPSGPGTPGEPGVFQAGPGGCKNQEECKAYCETHQEECKNSQQGMPSGAPGMPGGPEGSSGGQGGPGGCKTPEECQSYCQTHQEECRTFQSPTGGVPDQMQMAPTISPSMPGGCQGENCLPAPTPTEPPAPGAEGSQIPPTGIQPMMQIIMPNTMEGQMPSQGLQPPTVQTQPMMQPGQQMPMEQIMPAQPGSQPPPPPPTSAISPQSLLGLIFSILNLGSSH